MTTIRRLLVANRGEIARRVFRTCRDLGIETVAVFSEADAGLRFVAEADAAVALPGNTPAETYLRGDLVVEAARASGADAVHPGYGFLSESADFARMVIDAGLTWVGPSPASIESMGSKIEAKKLMAAAGVPVLPVLSPESVTEADLPLLVKASAGGGGRGMRVVRSLDEVAAAVEQASDEAGSAFGDATVFCEPYVEGGRHIEVQVIGDTFGNVNVLGERDCSIQRRHQKVVEEAPAPLLSGRVRTAIHDAARAAATAIDYVGAGTVEFLVRERNDEIEFFFLEMNTRLQVEHPVTECITGLDLVEMQISIAENRFVCDPAGVSRGTSADESGAAVEVRLYAEDPSDDWRPQSGRLTRFDFPGVASELDRLASYGIRLDSGFVAGDEVSTYYDAMLAKVICWAPTREQALRRLAAALAGAKIHGVRTNRDLLVQLLRHPAMIDGDVSTDFLRRHEPAALAPAPVDDDAVRLGAVAAAVALAERDRASRKVQRRIPVGWRNVVSQPQITRFVCEDAGVPRGATADESVIEVRWYAGYRLAERLDVTVSTASPGAVVLDIGGVSRTFEVFLDGDRVDVESSLGHVALRRVPRFVDPAEQIATGSLLAPMPGTVVSVSIDAGDEVVAGQPMLVLEAMKMQHTVFAPHDGVVAEISVTVGEQVRSGSVLAVVQDETARDDVSEGATP